MPRIDFYLVEDTVAQAWLRYACRLVEKAYMQGLRTHIHTADENMTMQMDELLWVFRERSFIPHQFTCAPNELCAVTLNHQQVSSQRDVLVNLAAQTPAFYDQFERVLEVVGGHDTMKQQGRQRFRFYQQRGASPAHHVISR